MSGVAEVDAGLVLESETMRLGLSARALRGRPSASALAILARWLWWSCPRLLYLSCIADNESNIIVENRRS